VNTIRLPLCPIRFLPLFGLAVLGFSVLALAESAANTSDGLALADADAVYELDPLSVQAVEHYRAVSATSATRTDTPIESIPQTINVVPAQVLEDLDDSRIDRALNFSGGVVKGNDFGGLQFENYSVRGFSSGDIYRNGFPANRGRRPAPDSSSIERIEVLKGPASGLFGRGDPGGLINYVTKRPQNKTFANVRLSAGSWDRYRGTLDLNTPLNESGTLLARLNLAYEDNASFRDFVYLKRHVITPSLTWHITNKTTLHFDAEVMRNESTFDRGITTVNGRIDVMDHKRFLGEPGDSLFRNDSHLEQLTLEHKLMHNWTLRLTDQYWAGHMHGIFSQPSIPVAPNYDIAPRERRRLDYRWHGNMVMLDLLGKVEIAKTQHNLLIGLEYEEFKTRYISLGSATFLSYGIDIYNPVYGVAPAPAIPTTGNTGNPALTESKAINFQDQITFTDRLSGQIGLRFENYQLDNKNSQTGLVRHEEKDVFTPRAGLVYQWVPGLNTFFGVSKSFKPNGIDEENNSRKPQEGLGYDVGLKFSLLDGRLGGTLAFFHTIKENVLTSNPDYPATSAISQITVGEQRSQGFDLQIAGQVSKALRVIAAYAYIDAEVTQSNNANLPVGFDLGGVARNAFSVLSVYQLQGDALKGSEIGASVSYLGERYSSNSVRRVIVPDHTLVDLFVRWKFSEKLTVGLNINNLFDRSHYDGVSSETRIVPGAPLNFKANVSYSF